MKKIITAASFLTLLATPAIAEEVIDPSNMTKVYTQAAVFLTSSADVRFSSMYTGSWSEKSDFAGFVEGNFGDRDSGEDDKWGLEYKNGRAQYFQVNEMNNKVLPRLGFSFDVIHERTPKGAPNISDDTLLYSAGLLGMVNPQYTPGFMVFPNVAYTTGDVFGESADGFMVNLFASRVIGDSGAFFNLWPEYLDVEGDNVDLESSKLNLLLASPVKSNRKQWLMTKLTYGKETLNYKGATMKDSQEMGIEVGMKWYF